MARFVCSRFDYTPNIIVQEIQIRTILWAKLLNPRHAYLSDSSCEPVGRPAGGHLTSQRLQSPSTVSLQSANFTDKLF